MHKQDTPTVSAGTREMISLASLIAAMIGMNAVGLHFVLAYGMG